MTDIIDILAGIERGSRLDAVRATRTQARENAQASFEALFEPADPGTFSLAERYAVATFVARLHRYERATDLYADLLADENEALVAPVLAAADSGAASGPTGEYREPALRDEGAPVAPWTAPASDLGDRLAAALTHTHLLVIRPREARADAIRALVDAGWSADDIVSLSQLVSFLSFQLRLAWGLTVLNDNPATEGEA